jgi:hypothetical protein
MGSGNGSILKSVGQDDFVHYEEAEPFNKKNETYGLSKGSGPDHNQSFTAGRIDMPSVDGKLLRAGE